MSRDICAELYNAIVALRADWHDADPEKGAIKVVMTGSAADKLGDDTLKKIAVEITEKLRRSTTVDWQVRESVRARLRILVRRTLKKWKYPPVGEEAAIKLVLKQAEALSNTWST